MIGGLMKTTSRFAVAAAAGLFVGGIALTPAQAADLGGDCCADLEERVAELEATTVRKGNRKVSLKISGQVNKLLLIWDDGDETDIYVTDNIQSSTRFRFTGSAAIRPGWSAGYYLEWESTSDRSNTADQVNNQRRRTGGITLRHAVWWVKSDKFGSIWLGQHSTATDNLYLLSLGGAGVASTGDIGLTTAGFQLRTSGVAGNAGLTGQRFGRFVPSFDQPRADIVRYDSPSIIGCVLSASWGENDLWDVAARCKKELNSIKILFGIGYIERKDERSFTTTTINDRRNDNTFIASGSVIHDPSGLFLTAWYAQQEYTNGTLLASGCLAGPANPNGCRDNEAFWIQGGVYRRWNDLGKTSIYVDYGHFDDAGTGQTAAGFASGNQVIVGTDTDVYGIGIVQKVDAAAMEFYADYHHIEVDASTDLLAGGNRVNENIEDFDRVILGARIKF